MNFPKALQILEPGYRFLGILTDGKFSLLKFRILVYSKFLSHSHLILTAQKRQNFSKSMFPTCCTSLILHLYKDTPALSWEKTTLMVKGRAYDSAAIISYCLSFFLFAKSFLGLSYLFISRKIWCTSWARGLSIQLTTAFLLASVCYFCSNSVSRMSSEMVPHRNTPQQGNRCLCSWKERLLVRQAVRWSVKIQNYRGVSDSHHYVFP